MSLRRAKAKPEMPPCVCVCKQRLNEIITAPPPSLLVFVFVLYILLVESYFLHPKLDV